MNDLVFVETSIWIDALRGRPRSTVERLHELIDADRVALSVAVRLEILSCASGAQFRRLSGDLSALPTFSPTPGTWREIERWIEIAVNAGQRFGIGDLLIAAVAAEHDGAVWSTDSDFVRLHELGLIELFDPAA